MIGGAIAWLIARGLSPVLSWLVLGGVAVAVLGGATWFVHHQWDVHVGEPYRIEGDQRTAKRMQAQIDGKQKTVDERTAERDQARVERDKARQDLATSESNLKTVAAANEQLAARIDGKGGLVEQIGASKKTIAFLQGYAAQLRAANRQIVERLNAEIAKAQPDVERARAVAASPVEDDFAKACREADRFLIDLGRRALLRAAT